MAYNKDKNFKIGKYLLRYKRPVILGPLFKILETAGDIITPFLMGLIIDVGVSSANKNYIISSVALHDGQDIPALPVLAVPRWELSCIESRAVG